MGWLVTPANADTYILSFGPISVVTTAEGGLDVHDLLDALEGGVGAVCGGAYFDLIVLCVMFLAIIVASLWLFTLQMVFCVVEPRDFFLGNPMVGWGKRGVLSHLEQLFGTRSNFTAIQANFKCDISK